MDRALPNNGGEGGACHPGAQTRRRSRRPPLEEGRAGCSGPAAPVRRRERMPSARLTRGSRPTVSRDDATGVCPRLREERR